MRDHRGNWRADWAGDAAPGAVGMDKPALYRIRDHALGGSTRSRPTTATGRCSPTPIR